MTLVLDSLWRGANVATMEGGQYNEINAAAIGVKDGKIAWIGEEKDLPALTTAQEHCFAGGWVTPGLIDCHSHLIFAGSRANEFEQRQQGVSYESIAKNGGGIRATVTATRNATLEELTNSAARRLEHLMRDGVTTIEIKSGYGLTLDSEIKMLQAASRLQENYPVTLKKTCLAAHAMPPEFDDKDLFIDYLCTTVLPEIARLGIADAVDAFCEGIAFSAAQLERYFATATGLGLDVKLHAEQLSALGGSQLAAKYAALSVDHLEYMQPEDVQAIAKSGTVAVLLPGAFYALNETQKPPVALLKEQGVPMAIATDSNPGTSPVLSLRLMMNMACTLFGLTPEDALAGTTIHAARALGISATHGSLAVGKVADFVCWSVDDISELSYWIGGQLMDTRIHQGVIS